ncbi:AAA family ATPase [Minwuia thermotolerans]|uniref:AAA family ATPase n=1 Tax=Minwuia thermotolerans TaxID=2056226 RepID=UPI000D6DC537|nr:AAA family ATPase [Minwuia thermotolerans]
MIEVIGIPGTSEHDAALKIADALAKLWPGLRDTPKEEDHVRIAANVKISGYRVSDVDVVVAAKFRPGRRFVPRRVLNDSDGKKIRAGRVAVRSIVAAIEVKDHPASSVRLVGDSVIVPYKERGKVDWKDATDQNVAQAHAMKSYFSGRGSVVWVYRCLVMQGLNEISLAGAVPSTFNGTAFLGTLAAVNGVYQGGKEYVLSSGPEAALEAVLNAPIFDPVVPSALDRKRMDRIAARRQKAEQVAELLGKKPVHLRGHGGTGKTVLLLQSAWQAYQSLGKRSLVLTYNRALAADIQRSLALMGIPSGGHEGGGIEVTTVMSLMYTWFNRLGAATTSNDGANYADYEARCAEVVEFFRSGTLTSSDVEAATADDPARLEFDAILVDEAQDWPQAEAELLVTLYGPDRIALADGTLQLVRGRQTNWRSAGVLKGQQETIPLKRCLRMKANLGRAANAIAEEAGLNWSVDTNDEAAGGRVILSLGDYADARDLRHELENNALESGNDKIDFLHCVPPSGVKAGKTGRWSSLGRVLRDEGHGLWDGVNERTRRDFPRSKDLYRVVQYESCRGLEGWVVVLDGFDEFWQAKYDEELSRNSGPDEGARDPGDVASAVAWRWCMIALTRPIDTLVITVRDADSELARVLRRAADRLGDVFENWQE